MQRSNVTLQPFPSIKEVVADLFEGYLSEQGSGDFFDMAKVLYSTSHEDIVKELICQAEEINEREMLREGLCAECGSHLRYRPNLERFDCSNPECALSYSGPVQSIPLSAKVLTEYCERSEAV